MLLPAVSVLALIFSHLALAGGSRYFDGDGDWVNLGDISAMEGIGAMTQMAWIYSDIAQPNAPNYVVSKASGQGLFFSHTTAAYDGHFGIYDGSDWQTSGTVTNSIADNEWVHFAGTYDGTNTMRVYENGVLQSSRDEGTFTSASNANDICIGSNCSTNEFTGKIADVRFYNRQLSAAEIVQAMHCLNAPMNGLVGQWILWESGTAFKDFSGSGNNGSNVNTIESGEGPPTSWCSEPS